MNGDLIAVLVGLGVVALWAATLPIRDRLHRRNGRRRRR